jgi:hypothetical protein
MKQSFSATRRGKLFLNLAMIAASIGLVVGFEAIRMAATPGSSSLLTPEIQAGVASPTPEPTPKPTPTPEPTPTPAPTGCSPGFYIHHQSSWVGICCDGADQRSCKELLFALDASKGCKGSDASCGRSAAAEYLDACTGCSE